MHDRSINFLIKLKDPLKQTIVCHESTANSPWNLHTAPNAIINAERNIYFYSILFKYGIFFADFLGVGSFVLYFILQQFELNLDQCENVKREYK